MKLCDSKIANRLTIVEKKMNNIFQVTQCQMTVFHQTLLFKLHWIGNWPLISVWKRELMATLWRYEISDRSSRPQFDPMTIGDMNNWRLIFLEKYWTTNFSNHTMSFDRAVPKMLVKVIYWTILSLWHNLNDNIDTYSNDVIKIGETIICFEYICVNWETNWLQHFKRNIGRQFPSNCTKIISSYCIVIHDSSGDIMLFQP